MILIGIAFTLLLMCAVICHIMAESRGRRRALWAVIGLSVGPFAVVALLIMGKAADNTFSQE